LQSLTGSKTVEVSEDRKHMRTREDPGKWSLAGVEPTSFSTLDASVPEFVPGHTFRVPVMQSDAPDAVQPQTSGKESAAVDTASEVSETLDEMSVSTVTASETAHFEDAPAAAAVIENDDAAIERLNSPSDDTQNGMIRSVVMSG